MAITVVGSEASASGQVTGEVVVGPFTMEDGDLFVAAIMQDIPVPVDAINAVTPDNAGPFTRGQVSASPSGTYRVIARFTPGGSLKIWYSIDRGRTWIASPSVTGALNNASCTAWDDGTFHVVAQSAGGSSSYFHWNVHVGGAWSSAVLIWNVGFTVGIGSYVFTDGSGLVAYLNIGSAAYPWVSTDGGATWTSYANGSTSCDDAIFVDSYLFLLSPDGALISRFNYSTLVWTYVSAATGCSAGSAARILAASDTEFYVVSPRGGSPSHVDIAHSVDAGVTWSMLCTNEALPAGLGWVGADGSLSGAVSFGADAQFHFCGVDASGPFVEYARDTAGSGTYSQRQTLGHKPVGTTLVVSSSGRTCAAYRPTLFHGLSDRTNEFYLPMDFSGSTGVIIALLDFADVPMSFDMSDDFAELASLKVDAGVVSSSGTRFMWIGYRFWHTGDPEFSSFFVTPNGSDYVAIEAAIVFRGVDPTVPPHAGFQVMDPLASEFESPLFAGTPFPGRKALVISGGMMYGDTGSSWTDQPPIVAGQRMDIATGGNLGWTGKVLELAADWGQSAAGIYDHRYITGLPVGGAGDPTMNKEAFGAVFYSFAEPVVPEPPAPDNLVTGGQGGRLYKVPT